MSFNIPSELDFSEVEQDPKAARSAVSFVGKGNDGNEECSSVEMALFGTIWRGLGGRLFHKAKSKSELGQIEKKAGALDSDICHDCRVDRAIEP
jgi:hypothetical protein